MIHTLRCSRVRFNKEIFAILHLMIIEVVAEVCGGEPIILKNRH
jgi:uncharacterized protein (DUF433 family)